jgi:hypothetical protein
MTYNGAHCGPWAGTGGHAYHAPLRPGAGFCRLAAVRKAR